MNYHGLPDFFNVCPGSCDPNCQFSHAFVVVHEDCYNIFHRKKKKNLMHGTPEQESISIIIQQQKQIWSCFSNWWNQLYSALLLLVVLFNLHFVWTFMVQTKVAAPFFGGEKRPTGATRGVVLFTGKKFPPRKAGRSKEKTTCWLWPPTKMMYAFGQKCSGWCLVMSKCEFWTPLFSPLNWWGNEDLIGLFRVTTPGQIDLGFCSTNT